MMYEKGYDKIKAYGNSKLANVLFTRQLAKRLKGWLKFLANNLTR